MISPLNSAGERTSTSASSESPSRGRMSSRNARRLKSGLGKLVVGGRIARHVDAQGEAVVEPVLATAVEDPDVAVAVQLELPVGPRGKPVVVVAVQHDGGVGADPRLRDQRGEVLTGGDVASDAVGQLAGPVPGDRARDMALLVRRWCRHRPRRSGRWDPRGARVPSRYRRGRPRWRRCDDSCRWCLLLARVDRRSAGQRKWGGMLRFRGPGDQPPDVGRSRRLNSDSRSVHDAAARCACRTTHGSTRIESSMATVRPSGPSSTTIPDAFR